VNCTAVHRVGCVVAGLYGIGLGASCASNTTAEVPPSGAKIVDGNQYVVLDAPLGSHIKRRVKLSDLRVPGISPVQSDKITSDTDMLTLPPTTGEVLRSAAGR
jgi:hypothetical protein